MMTALLIACGGGGGSSDGPVTSAETFQMRAAWDKFVQNSGSRSFRLTGRLSGNQVTGSGTMVESALAPATFEGASAQRKTSTLNLSVTNGNVTVPITASDTSYFDDRFNPLGDSSESEYCVVTSTSVSIPQIARVGDKGILYAAECFTDSSKQVTLGTETVSFSLEPDTASSALLKMTLMEKDTAGNSNLSDTIIIRMTPSGDLTYISEKVTYQDGDMLNITY